MGFDIIFWWIIQSFKHCLEERSLPPIMTRYRYHSAGIEKSDRVSLEEILLTKISMELKRVFIMILMFNLFILDCIWNF